MKKIFKYMFAVVAGVAALTACTNEPEEGVTPTPEEGKTLTVVASMNDTTKAIFTDGEGLKWSVGDMLVAHFEKWDEEKGEMVAAYANSNILNNETITDGVTGTFTFAGINTGDAWFAKGQNIGGVYNLEFAFKNEITQPAAGGIDPSLIKLLSDTKTITDTDASVEVEMKLVGTMMRYLIYSSKGTYATEQVTSVKLVGNENFSGGGAVIAYNLPDGTYKQADGSYGENCVVFHGCNSDYINVKLNTPAALNATSAEGCIGKGVYMPVPPISLTGYKYVVTTTNYRFTFDASSKAVTFKENEVKNVLLDVDNEKVEVEELVNITKAITRDATSVGNFTIDGAAHNNKKIGGNFLGACYITWAIDGVKKEGNWTIDEEIQTLYKSIKFLCHDGNSAAAPEADWLSIYYPTDENGLINEAHPYLTISANTTGVERKSLVQVLISTPAGYTWNGETGEDIVTDLQFEITQEAASAELEATLDVAYDGTAVSKDGADVTVGTFALTADDVDALADWATYCNVTINGGASVNVAADGTITATIPANKTSDAKEYTLTIKDKKDNDLVPAVTIAQEANPEGEVVEPTTDVYSYTIGGWSQAEGNKTKNWSFGSGESNPVEHWVIVIQNVKKNDVTYTADMPDEDKKALICQMFKWTSEEYDNAFAELTVFWGAGETIIKLTHIKANTGGARELSGNIYEADGTTVAVTYKWNQDAA